jgi:outer membrane receptor for ferrienterochelin and colicin
MNDKHFLEQLDLYPHKTVYAKIIALTLDEKPVEEITGKVTAGTINVDGSSAVRRTCNLTLLAYNTKVTDYYWGLTNKFKLQVGVENLIDKRYPNIIWFNQGIYAITSFSSS